MRLGFRNVPGYEIRFIKIIARNVVFPAKRFQKNLFGVWFNGNRDWTVQVCSQLANQIILESNDRTLIDEIIRRMIEDEGLDSIAVLHKLGRLLFLIIHQRQRLYSVMSEQYDNQGDDGDGNKNITNVFPFQNNVFSIISSTSSASEGSDSR